MFYIKFSSVFLNFIQSIKKEKKRDGKSKHKQIAFRNVGGRTGAQYPNNYIIFNAHTHTYTRVDVVLVANLFVSYSENFFGFPFCSARKLQNLFTRKRIYETFIEISVIGLVIETISYISKATQILCSMFVCVDVSASRFFFINFILLHSALKI